MVEKVEPKKTRVIKMLYTTKTVLKSSNTPGTGAPTKPIFSNNTTNYIPGTLAPGGVGTTRNSRRKSKFT